MADSLKLSRRHVLEMLAVGAGLARTAPLQGTTEWSGVPASSSAADSPAAVAEPRPYIRYPVVSRRVLIPAPGTTLRAVIVRPDAPGSFAALLIPNNKIHDANRLRRLASQGYLLLWPLSRQRLSVENDAAILAYLRAHPAAGEIRRVLA